MPSSTNAGLWFTPWTADHLKPWACESCWHGWVPGILRVTRFHAGGESETFLRQLPDPFKGVPKNEESDHSVVRHYFAVTECPCLQRERERRIREEAQTANKKLQAQRRVKGLLQ